MDNFTNLAVLSVYPFFLFLWVRFLNVLCYGLKEKTPDDPPLAPILDSPLLFSTFRRMTAQKMLKVFFAADIYFHNNCLGRCLACFEQIPAVTGKDASCIDIQKRHIQIKLRNKRNTNNTNKLFKNCPHNYSIPFQGAKSCSAKFQQLVTRSFV